jgi:outer membrane scaffolding protein for murein synthesis (MipA/OmpV family)
MRAGLKREGPMPNRFPALAALLFALPAAAAEDANPAQAVAAAPRPSDWTFTVGAGAFAVPSYPGASSARVMPVPVLDVRYRDRFFLSPFDGVGVNAIATPRFHAGVAVLPDFGRSASSADRLRGWGVVGAGANAKVFAAYVLGSFALLADVRRQLGAGDGTLVDAGVTRPLPLARHFILIPTATVTWANARYMRAYFGVDPAQSAIAQVPVHGVGSGMRDAALTLLAVVPVDERWSVQSIVRAELLLGDAAASPVTQQRVQPTFGGFMAYRL